MPPGETPPTPSVHADPGYPTTTPPDPVYPCQTVEPLGAPLDGVATPAIWSRLSRPLERSLVQLWEGLRLLRRHVPARWVTLQYGRIAVNAHGWERLRSGLCGEPADLSLVGPPLTGIQRLPEMWEAQRVRRSRRRLLSRLRAADETGEELLLRSAARDPSDIDTPELSRGLLDDRTWSEILLPWLGLRLLREETLAVDARLYAAVGVEQRNGAEVGRRLTTAGVLSDPTDVAYLTIEERILAVNEASPFWMRVVTQRRERVDAFVARDLPARFWGLPRVGAAEKG